MPNIQKPMTTVPAQPPVPPKPPALAITCVHHQVDSVTAVVEGDQLVPVLQEGAVENGARAAALVAVVKGLERDLCVDVAGQRRDELFSVCPVGFRWQFTIPGCFKYIARLRGRRPALAEGVGFTSVTTVIVVFVHIDCLPCIYA